MPPKKIKKPPTVWCPTTLKALVTTAGEFREYYLPLSDAEIQADLQHLTALVHRGQARAAAAREASSEGVSPTSQQGEDENESGNPAEQLWGGSKVAEAAGGSGVVAPAGPHAHEHHAVMA